MIKSLTGEIIQDDVLPSNKRCIVHFVDFELVNRTKDYLKSAWKAGLIGSNHHYLIEIGDLARLPSLKFSEIFDFQRLFIAASIGVKKQLDSLI